MGAPIVEWTFNDRSAAGLMAAVGGRRARQWAIGAEACLWSIVRHWRAILVIAWRAELQSYRLSFIACWRSAWTSLGVLLWCYRRFALLTARLHAPPRVDVILLLYIPLPILSILFRVYLPQRTACRTAGALYLAQLDSKYCRTALKSLICWYILESNCRPIYV